MNDNVFDLGLMVIRRGSIFILLFADAWTHRFSPTGFNVIFTRFHLVLNQDIEDYGVVQRNITFVGANCIRPFMIQIHFPICGTMKSSFVLQAYSQVN